MPLYSDSSYYSGGAQLYSPYYVPSTSYAPSFSGYGRSALSGTYSAPPARSTFAAINRHYKPMLTPISETYAARRPQNLASLTRINSPKLNLHSSYVPPRPIQINTADIDVSSSRYRRTQAKSKSPEKIVYGKATSPPKDNDSPFMPRVDQNDPPQTTRSTIKRDRNIVRLSTMRSRSKSRSKKSDSGSSKSSMKKDSDSEATTGKDVSVVPHSPSPETKGKTSWRDKFGDDLLTKNKDVVRKTPGELILEKHIIKPKHKEPEQGPEQGEIRKTEIIYLEPKLRKSIRRHSLAKCPSFKDICKDISAELKVNDDLNAGELRRRASLIFEEEQQNILQKIVESGAESVDALVADDEQIVEPILDEVDQTNPKPKRNRHVVTAIVEVDNMDERTETKITDAPIEQNKSPKWKVVVEQIEEDHAIHTVFKLPKKKAKTNADGTPKVAKPKPITKIKKSESGEDFWGTIGTRETVYYDQRRRDLLALEMKKKEEDLLAQSNLEHLQKPNSGCEDKTVQAEVKIKKPEDTKSKMEKTELLPKSKSKTNVSGSGEKSTVVDAGKGTEKVEQKSVSIEKAKVKTVEKTTTETKIKIGQKQKIVLKLIETPMHPKLTENKLPKMQNATVTIVEKQSIITKRIESAQKLTLLPSKSPEVATSSTITPTSTDASQITTNKYDANMNNKNVVKIQPSKNSEIQPPLKITTGPKAKSPEIKQKQTKVKDFATMKEENKIPATTATTEHKSAAENINKMIKGISGSNVAASNDVDTTCDKMQNTTENSSTETRSVKKRNENQVTSSSKMSPIYRKYDEKASSKKSSKSSTKNSKVCTSADEINDKSLSTNTGDDLNKTNSLSKFPTIANLNDLSQTTNNKSSATDEYCISGEESDVTSVYGSDSEYSSDDASSSGEDEMGLKRRHKKKNKDKNFDPKKVVKLDHKRKCYVVDESPKYPLIATPRPLQKRWHYYSESETESEETSDENSSDESCFVECAQSGNEQGKEVRMSTCSNDSGFEGGTAPTSPKKMLGKIDFDLYSGSAYYIHTSICNRIAVIVQ